MIALLGPAVKREVRVEANLDGIAGQFGRRGDAREDVERDRSSVPLRVNKFQEFRERELGFGSVERGEEGVGLSRHRYSV